MPPKSIIVLGGGITGLSATFHLSRAFPATKITLLEKSDRLGGWIRSRRVNVREKDGSGREATMLIESGPRTLRSGGDSVLELVNLLGLKDSLIKTPKTSPAARNRFLHIPGTNGLTPLPSSALSLLTSPKVAAMMVPPVLREPFRQKNFNPSGVLGDDESVDSFLSRRFGEKFARTFGSALVHGVYATDSRLLSVRAAFPVLWDAAVRGGGSVVRGMLIRTSPSGGNANEQNYQLGEVPAFLADASVFSFRDGMETLPKSLEKALRAKSNVEIKTSTEMQRVQENKDTGNFEVVLKDGSKISSSHIASTIPTSALDSLLETALALPHLKVNPMSTVTVVNIIFPPTNKLPIHPPGFGYLIPRPASGYPSSLQDSISQNLSSFLGTVFDSCALSEQDTGDSGFTKLTVMLGGPYGSDCTNADASIVIPQLQRHLHPNSHVKLPDPVLYETHTQTNCIPTPSVGHIKRTKELRAVLRGDPWKGRLLVLGAGIDGVSVPDCVSSGRSAVKLWNDVE